MNLADMLASENLVVRKNSSSSRAGCPTPVVDDVFFVAAGIVVVVVALVVFVALVIVDVLFSVIVFRAAGFESCHR